MYDKEMVAMPVTQQDRYAFLLKKLDLMGKEAKETIIPKLTYDKLEADGFGFTEADEFNAYDQFTKWNPYDWMMFFSAWEIEYWPDVFSLLCEQNKGSKRLFLCLWHNYNQCANDVDFKAMPDLENYDNIQEWLLMFGWLYAPIYGAKHMFIKLWYRHLTNQWRHLY